MRNLDDYEHILTGDAGILVRDLIQEIRTLRIETMCDVCIGRADDPECMCGGTGKARDAAIWLREQLLRRPDTNAKNLATELARARTHGIYMYRVLMSHTSANEPCDCGDSINCSFCYFESLGARNRKSGE